MSLQQQKASRQDIISFYKQLKRYSEVGRQLGISRQRVEQIIKKYGDAETATIHKKYRVKNYTDCCLECQRPWSEKVKHSGKRLCHTCSAMIRKREKGLDVRRNWFRRFDYPVNCLNPDCQKPIPLGTERTRGYCRRCYDRLITHKTAGYRAGQKRYKERHKEAIARKRRIYYKAYYRKNKNKVLAYQKKYIKEHIEQARARWRYYAKKRYWKEKAERELGKQL